MRVPRYITTLLAAATLSSGAAPAPPAPESAALRSYSQARAVLDRAVSTMGGESALRGLGTLRRQMSEDWVDVGQGRRPWRGSPPADRLPPHAGFAGSPMESYVVYQGRRFVESSRYADAPSDYTVRLDAADAKRGFQTITYVDEKPYFRAFGPDEIRTMLGRELRRHPEGVLRMALDRLETLEYVGTGTDAGRAHEVFSFVDPLGVRVLVYVEANTGLVAKTETLRDHPIAGDTSSETIYTDYRPTGALRLPFAVVDRVAGVPTRRLRVESIEPDAAFPEERLDPPADFARVVEDPPEPKLETIAPGVHLIRGAYNVMFAEFRDYVVVVETPSGERYARACLQIIRATTSKPIRYAVASHFHSDHLGGVRTFVAEGIPILTTPDAVEVIERALASPRTLRADTLSRRPRRAQLQTVTDSRVFDDGKQRLELHDFGPAPHVEHILGAYFPRQHLLHVADLFDVLTPDLVIAGVDGVAMEKRIRALGLEVDSLIPVHGVPIGRTELERAFAVRAKYSK